jgi:hypothetical protein
MASAFPVLWTLNGTPCTGLAEVGGQRIVLTSRHRSLSFPLEAIGQLDVLRSAADRLRGLPVLALSLAGGEVVRVASLGGPGSLHELTEAVDEGWTSARFAGRRLRGNGRTAAWA